MFFLRSNIRNPFVSHRSHSHARSRGQRTMRFESLETRQMFDGSSILALESPSLNVAAYHAGASSDIMPVDSISTNTAAPNEVGAVFRGGISLAVGDANMNGEVYFMDEWGNTIRLRPTLPARGDMMPVESVSLNSAAGRPEVRNVSPGQKNVMVDFTHHGPYQPINFGMLDPRTLLPYIEQDNVQSLRSFPWLTHLDRQIVSPTEQLRVGAFSGNESISQFFAAQGGGGSNRDSVWLDLGFPVRTTADGRSFKPLFAFHVPELDNRVNVNGMAEPVLLGTSPFDPNSDGILDDNFLGFRAAVETLFAEMLQTTLDEEKAADEKLNELALSKVNAQAAR